MTVSHQEDFESHSEAFQIPLFVAGMLSQTEREQVEQHLKLCSSCRKELAEEQRLQPSIQKSLKTWPKSSEHVLQHAKEKIARRSLQETREGMHAIEASHSWTMRLEEWIRRIFRPRWVPALAVLVILIQGAFLQWLLTNPSMTRPSGMEGPILERDLPPIAENTNQFQRIQVVFAPEFSIKDIQTLLGKVQGTIARGPGPNDEFVIELTYENPEQLNMRMNTLKNSKIIQQVEPVRP